ncbi:RNA polymerase I-specific transcription initiation factor RRN3 [Fomitiporia mediterranea MF3/22]|uniref:RNA polymerase I-specific transcription initiation factor RRN3 n=1 Tax=Fomitiporia mediterranea (strain MF3/22) TaxID=694068 RepID=UPI0004408551|nr:RNA polymerase I-specific transcription initiation factor RRN3 [Fomitiporia mediterranea MF3/22]EJD01473.1 RNA polymerase I-specific transcription initiation factor RRN3 [Fomitiporia mediterranea MF3/22]
MEVKTMNVFEHFRKSPSESFSSSRSASLKDLKDLATRPIASNSRVRRDEKYRRDMYLAFIDNALNQKARGINEHYDDLVRQFSPTSLSAAGQAPQSADQQQLRGYLTALTHVVSKLDRAHFSLVDAIVSMPWTTMDSAFVKTYISFVGMLVSARPEYLTLVLERAAQSLTYYSARKALDSGFAESSSSPLTRRIVYDRVHSLVAQLLELIPTLPSALYPLLARNFPHKRQREAEHVTYIRNLLRLSDYCPELWDRILGLVVDRTLQIDVEIQVELEELEAEGADEEPEEIFHLDLFDTIIGQEANDSDSESEDEDDGGISDLSTDAGSDSDADAQEEQMNVKHVRDMVSKLDSILEVIFKHLDRLHSAIVAPSETLETTRSSPASNDVPSEGPNDVPVPSANPLSASTTKRQALAESHFHALLSIFERTILRTFKSRYTQFLIFWYSSLDTQFRDRFLGTIVSAALLEPSQPVVTRAAAASYVASYVSRAAFVARGETQMVVRVLCQFLETHLDEFEAYAKQAANARSSGYEVLNQQSAEQHAVFYAAAQAMFLIFCFRWRDLTQRDENDADIEEFEDVATINGGVAHRAWMPELKAMQRVVNSALNPLKVCSSNVVQQFARVAQRVGFIYCFSILEANRRSEYASDSKNVSASDSNPALWVQSFDADLTTFFPFDPFKLSRSSAYIEGIYREWASVAIDDSEDEDEDDEDHEDEVEEGEGGEVDGTLPVDEDLHMHGPASFVSDAGGLGESFGGMSISPAQPQGIAAA